LNSEIILEVAGKKLGGALPFPDPGGQLLGAGSIIRWIVHLVVAHSFDLKVPALDQILRKTLATTASDLGVFFNRIKAKYIRRLQNCCIG
jgi:hypothetical protein